MAHYCITNGTCLRRTKTAVFSPLTPTANHIALQSQIYSLSLSLSKQFTGGIRTLRPRDRSLQLTLAYERATRSAQFLQFKNSISWGLTRRRHTGDEARCSGGLLPITFHRLGSLTSAEVSHGRFRFLPPSEPGIERASLPPRRTTP